MRPKVELSRRRFLKTAAAAAVGPLIIPSSVLGLDGHVAPSNRVTMACIGVGGQGMSDMRCFLGSPDCQVVAVCDVDVRHRDSAKSVVEKQYADKAQAGAYKGCDTYNDFRDVLKRGDIDTVMIGTPDHWHVPIAVAAAKAGKDIYSEKPLTKTIAEGRILCDVIARYGRVFQTGTQLRSTNAVRYACELVRNGRIGELKRVYTYLPASQPTETQPVMPVPEGFDYELWLGPAPWAPYTEKRCHYTFRYVSDYSGGTLTDLGAHDNDIAQWGNGTELSGPVEVEGSGNFPRDGLFNTATDFKIHYKYANGVELICSTDTYPSGTGARFEGTEGWIYTRWIVDAEPKSILTSKILPNETHLYACTNHWQNFIDCVKTRKPTIAPAEIGHRSVSISHIGNISMKLGRKLEWDPSAEQFVNDAEANLMLSRPMRAPWQL